MKNNKNQPEEPEEPRTQTEKEAQPEEKDAATPKPKYVFKILPVDPKNSFDFEDVADK